jgi:putative flippase GtrA
VNLDQLVDRIFGAVPGVGPWYETPEGRKKVRYALVSVVAVPVGEFGVLIFNVAGLTAVVSALLGNSLGAIPSYVLNRYWVWGKTEKNNLLTEILPFWIITLIGILFSLYTAHVAGQFTKHHHITSVLRLVILLVANLAAFGILWVAKYILFNKVLFVRKDDDTATPSSEVG